LLDPHLRDPLSYAHSEIFTGLAKWQGANLVADLPDSLFNLVVPAKDGKVSARAFLNGLRAADLAHIDVKDGWMTVKPTRPAKERVKRTDRVALAKLLRAAWGKGYAPLDPLAEYASRCLPFGSTDVAKAYSYFFLPGTSTQEYMDWNMLRLYASFTEGQRKALARGSVEFRTLSPAQIDYVAAMVYGPSNGVYRNVSVDPTDGLTDEEREALEDPPSVEPTEVLPNGLPPGGSLSGFDLLLMETVVQDAGEKQPVLPLADSYTPDELAMYVFLRDDTPLARMPAPYMPAFARFRVGERKLLPFQFSLSKDVSMKRELRDLSFKPDGAVVDLASLPESFRRQYEEALAANRKPGSPPSILSGGAVKP
jgi:hypothetical protein